MRSSILLCFLAFMVIIYGVIDLVQQSPTHIMLWLMFTVMLALAFVCIMMSRAVYLYFRKRILEYDAVTELPNRHCFFDYLQTVIRRAQGMHEKFGLLLINLDHFKNVNDLHGTEVGNQVLKQIAVLLKHHVRGSDFLASLGGDEFMLLCPLLQKTELNDAAERILKLLSQAIVIDVAQVRLSASIGIVLYPDAGNSVSTLLRHADMALIQAKKNGGNNYQYFTVSLVTTYQRQMRITQQLRDAIKHHEFSLVYQPIVDIASKTVVGAESLLRWRNAELGEMSPVEFIPIAENQGLIFEIGEWVLYQACAQLAVWRRLWPDKNFRFEVNCSPLQLQRQGFLELLKNVLTTTALKPSDVVLELTETALIAPSVDVKETLNQLKNMGVRIAIDDFGTGYSSLNYLKIFPISVIKIDQSFVRDIENNADSQAIVRAIMQLAKACNLEVVAEGVESAEQAAVLHSFGCLYAQGYFFSKPLSAGAFQAFCSA